ncbi:MAG: carboxyl transferase domain-containing protein, partial [Actinomycetota bacterium]
GRCAGAAAYSPSLTDWTVMVPGASQMFLTGPAVVRAATGEDVEPEVLGGAAIHSRESNVAHLLAADETRATAAVRRLLSFLPRAVGEVLPRLAAPLRTMPGPLDEVLPASPRAPFDMWRILDGVLDGGDRLELMSEFAPAMITALARLDGVPVGVVASQPARRGGILDSRGAAKVARFVAFCGRFGLPILTFVDVPGFLPGTTEERRGVINHGASMLAAYVEAPSPKLTVIVRKAYGGAYIAMGSRSVGADFTWAWPGAEVAVMGPEAAVGLLHRRELASAANEAELRAELAAGYRAAVTNPFVAAEAGIIDEVIYPGETRARMAAALRICLDPG